MKKLIFAVVVGLAGFLPGVQGAGGFTYQGQLTEAGQPADGLFDFQFQLLSAAEEGETLAPPVEQGGVALSNGVFAVALEFGSNVFHSPEVWLAIALRRSGSTDAFVNLPSRQRIGTAPRSWYAEEAGHALSAEVAAQATTADSVSPSSVTGEMIADQTITGQQLADGEVVRRLNGLSDQVALTAASGLGWETVAGGLRLTNAVWRLNGNADTFPGFHFLGTTDLQPLELRVNNWASLRFEPVTQGQTVNIVAGHAGNRYQSGLAGVTISGGGANYGVAGNWAHQVDALYGTIAGGMANRILVNASSSTISGGMSNQIGSFADRSTISGGSENVIGDEAWRSTISGGWQQIIGFNSYHATIGGGWSNSIASDSSVIAGGVENHVRGSARASTIAGGAAGVIETGARFSTISGGAQNVIEADAITSTISGGGRSRIRAAAIRSVVGGGADHVIGTGAEHAVIGGGLANEVGAASIGATIPGGISNKVSGAHGYAAGYRAKASAPGAFVWADGVEADFEATGTNEVALRATGGVRIVSGVDFQGTPLAGVALAPGSGSWSDLSDRESKTAFERLDKQEVLEKVARLAIESWSYRAEGSTIRHVGPVAQDFHEAFGLGEDPRRISTVDASGVALAALQGLHELVLRQQREIESLRGELEQLRVGRSPADGEP